jgi:hypothetical protein
LEKTDGSGARVTECKEKAEKQKNDARVRNKTEILSKRYVNQTKSEIGPGEKEDLACPPKKLPNSKGDPEEASLVEYGGARVAGAIRMLAEKDDAEETVPIEKKAANEHLRKVASHKWLNVEANEFDVGRYHSGLLTMCLKKLGLSAPAMLRNPGGYVIYSAI